jgi:hypothetical protein
MNFFAEYRDRPMAGWFSTAKLVNPPYVWAGFSWVTLFSSFTA